MQRGRMDDDGWQMMEAEKLLDDCLIGTSVSWEETMLLLLYILRRY